MLVKFGKKYLPYIERSYFFVLIFFNFDCEITLQILLMKHSNFLKFNCKCIQRKSVNERNAIKGPSHIFNQ